MVLVGVAAFVSLTANNGASTSLDSSEQYNLLLVTAGEDLHNVSLNGTAYVVDHAAADSTAMTDAARAFEADLARLAGSPSLASTEAPVLAATVRAWNATAAIRRAVLASGADGGVATGSTPALDDQLVAQLVPVSDQLHSLNVLNAAEVGAAQKQLASTQTASGVAITIAIGIGLVGALWLLRQLGERQEAVRRRERRLSALVENASDGILVIDAERRIVFVTPSFSEEFTDDSSGALELAELLHPDDRERTSKAWNRVVSGGAGTASEVEARLRHRDGEWRHVWAKLTNRLDDPAVDGVVLNVTDVSERHEFEQKLTHQALHDALTGLPNRDLLRQRMEHATSVPGRGSHSVLYLDCDDFKRVNDALGHQAGDQYLAEVGGRLVACVRPEDTVARLGGDEFAILLENTGAENAVLAARRIIAALVAPVMIGGKELHPRASIGVVSGQLGALHPETLLADADLAMYFAKRAGKGGYEVFNEAMRTDLLDRLELGEDLRSAIETSSLEVAYQPIIDLQTGGIVGAEALARWQHPSRGWVGPDVFIPLAEELGLVERIDAWVLRQACAQGQAWSQSGLADFKMAVNLSGRNLDQPDLVARVAEILSATGFPPAQLELELTEGVAINESAGAQQILEALKKLGVHLAIDDFGTGYSALSRLRNLPFDRLKIDKAFVDDIGHGQQGPMLVDTILEMAHVLGLEVVAEGVETATQAQYLRERACDFAQGYLFNRPMATAELTALLEGQRLPVVA
jgi:diguanylate cyclase (GGDEF)-like protein/PAS domain S-box-containing protein